MKAVILVGGGGTRLRPLTCNTPKAMVPVANRPFLEYVIGYLKSHQVDDIFLTLCYLPAPIQSYFGDGDHFGARLTYVVEPSALGTAGAVKNVGPFLDDTFVVLNGDIFTDLDLTRMIEFHRTSKSMASIALTPVADPTIYGVVETSGQGRVERFVEKPSWEAVTTNMINAGIYILEPEVLKHIQPGTYCMFEREIFPLLLRLGVPFFGYPSAAYWIDIGTPEKYLKLHHDLLLGQVTRPFPGEQLTPGVWVEGGCTIHPSAKLVGPVLVGRDCTIGSGARISGPAVIGPGSTVGADAVIEGAVLWSNVRLGVQVTVRDSIIGDSSMISDDTWVGDSSVLGDDVVIGRGNKLGHGIRVWPGKTLGPDTISF